MPLLGIDHGSVRVGLAVSDETDTFALPLETVPLAAAITRIREIAAEKNVSALILGMPRNMDGSYGPKAEEVRRFAERLKKETGLEVRFWDERLTTRAAERLLLERDVSRKRRKELVDKLAAHQILQNHLDALAFRKAEGETRPE